MNIIPRKRAAARCGFSISTLKREEAAGRFPKALRLTEARVGYVEAEVDEYISERIAARDAGEAA